MVGSESGRRVRVVVGSGLGGSMGGSHGSEFVEVRVKK